MEIRGRAPWAILLAAILGVAAGVAVAIAGPGSGGNESSTNDPLQLGIPLVDLACTGDSIMVVGYGAGRAPLDAAVADNPDRVVRYLRTDDSCDTLYAPVDAAVPDYVAYLGPFDSPADPCAERMTDEHKGDNVTRLNSGNQIYVKCLCVLDTATFPVLRPGMSLTTESGLWIRGLQGMLADIDAAAGNPTRFTEVDITGVYDQRTAARVNEIQAGKGVRVGPLNTVTWRILRKRACGTYSY
jgi:hypothetical protein